MTLLPRRIEDSSLRAIPAALLALACALAPVATGAQEATYPLPSYDVNLIDRSLMFSYSEPLDAASDYTQYAAFLTPSVFALAAPTEDWLGIGAMYAGSALMSFATGTLLKAVIERERPYMYFDDPPAAAIADGDYIDSFPSRHSIMAFTGAAFTATLFKERYPDSPYRVPAVIAAYVLAGVTAGLRVGSGSHFLTDVAGGAAIGTFFGFIVPYASSRLGWLD